ncbi:MAG: hypothetical protein M1381_07810 [Deltaproteobacteria bacterium]|nr:hypothetical protein [Deltaproteobacteria bacterium]
MKSFLITFCSLMLFTGISYAQVTITGQNGSINVPSAFVEKGVARIAVYNSYYSQTNMFIPNGKLENDTVYGAISYAPLKYIDISIGSLDSSSLVDSSQSLHYSGDLRLGIKGSYEVIPSLSIGALAEVLAYSKVTDIGYNGKAASYTLSLLVSYNMKRSSIGFPLIANLRIGHLWDNTQNLLTRDEDSLISPIGKYAMGIRGDNLTILGLSLLFPLPKYYIEPLIELTSQFANKYGSYSLTDQSYGSASFHENPLYLTLGLNVFTPVKGLDVTLGSGISLSKQLTLTQTSGSPVYITPRTIWIAGISYCIGE